MFPYYPQGDLHSFIKDQEPRTRVLPEKVIRHIFAQLVHIFKRLHAKGIAHRDLKQENVLVEFPSGASLKDPDFHVRLRVVLSDFGFAVRLKDLHGKGRYSCLGTPIYLAYEMLVPQK